MFQAGIMMSLLFSFYSAACDFKYRKITNKSIAVMGIIAILYVLLEYGVLNGAMYIVMLMPLWGMLFLLFAFKVTGAADVKLLCILSLLIGKDGIIIVLVISLIAGLMIGLIYFIKGEKIMPFAVAIFIGVVVYCYGKITCCL